MRVLLIDVDEGFISVVRDSLRREGVVVDVVGEGDEGVEVARREAYDVVLLSDGLPDLMGVTIVRRLRAAGVRAGVIMVTGFGGKILATIEALGAGADDVVLKPPHPAELVARVQAVARRSVGLADSVVRVGPISLDLAAKVARVGQTPMHLTGRQYQLLEVLMRRRGMTLTKDALMSHVYGDEDGPYSKIIDVFICKIRQALAKASAAEGLGEDARADRYLKTVWGRGYVLTAESSGRELGQVAA